MLTRRSQALHDDHNPVVWYSSPLLEAARIPHAFSTRLGGVSAGVFSSMNLGNPSGCDVQDPPECLAENHRRLFAAMNITAPRHARVHQVHSDAVVRVAAGHEHNPHAKADAIVTDDPESVISVRVADCVPVLIASDDGSRVAAIHAGWRGVVSGVVLAALRELRRIAHDSGADTPRRDPPPTTFIAAIGPSISLDAFEVGDEVVAEFARVFTADEMSHIVLHRPGRKPHIDLRRALAFQLIRDGISADRIDTTDRCTVRDAHEFFSHRRDNGVTGRLAAFIAPIPSSPPTPPPTPRSSPASRP